MARFELALAGLALQVIPAVVLLQETGTSFEKPETLGKAAHCPQKNRDRSIHLVSYLRLELSVHSQPLRFSEAAASMP